MIWIWASFDVRKFSRPLLEAQEPAISNNDSLIVPAIVYDDGALAKVQGRVVWGQRRGQSETLARVEAQGQVQL